MAKDTLTKRPGTGPTLVLLWGVVGVLFLFYQAVWRLAPPAIEPWISDHLAAGHVVLYVLSVLGLAFVKGHLAFHKSFAPRVVARSLHLGGNPGRLAVLLAPAYAMGLFLATPRRMVLSWSIVLFVVLAVALVRLLPQPWRGIIDAGVVAGLLWGMNSILCFFARAITGRAVKANLSLRGGGDES